MSQRRWLDEQGCFYLDQDSAVLLFCALHQAERTTTTGLHNRWLEVREYYAGDRRALLERLHNALCTIRPTGCDFTRIRWQMRPRGDLLWDAAFWLRRWRSSHRREGRLQYRQWRFMTWVLEVAFYRLDTEVPYQWDLIQLRDDLRTCVNILAEEMVRPPIRQHYHVENLGQPPWEQHYSLDELLPNWRNAPILADPPMTCPRTYPSYQ